MRWKRSLEGLSLVIQRDLKIECVKENEEQRSNLFHATSQVKGRVCSLIIDSGSCINMASTTMIETEFAYPRSSNTLQFQVVE